MILPRERGPGAGRPRSTGGRIAMDDAGAPAARPEHIPEAAVYDFDFFLDEALLTDPHERVRQILKEAPPVFWSPRRRHWVAMGHDAVFQACRDWERFSSEWLPREQMEAFLAMMPPGSPHIPRVRPISLDPPDHTPYRAALAHAFGPKSIKARTEEIRTLAAALLDAVAPKGHCDFIAAVAEPLPVLVFLKMMGLPQTRLAEFRALVHRFLAPGDGSPMEGAARMRMVADAIDDVILARRDEPRDDLISELWATEIGGEPMTFEIMEDFACLLFIAGLDTVINGIGFAVRHLAGDPDLQARLRTDPSLVPSAVEELLRRYTFVVPARRVTRDTEFFGWTLKENDKLMIYLPGADLDPAEFPTPEIFDLARENTAHLAFGGGPHRCVGSHLARLELQLLCAELVQRLPTFRLDPDAPTRFRAGNIIAIDELPIRWD
jgi:cytochrome P450